MIVDGEFVRLSISFALVFGFGREKCSVQVRSRLSERSRVLTCVSVLHRVSAWVL